LAAATLAAGIYGLISSVSSEAAHGDAVCTNYQPGTDQYQTCVDDFHTYASKPQMSGESGVNRPPGPAPQSSHDPWISGPVSGNTGSAPDISDVQAALINDLVNNDLAQVMPKGVEARQQSVNAPDGRSHRDQVLSSAWSRTVLAAKQQELQQAYAFAAQDPNEVSLQGARFSVDQWLGVSVTGANAVATFVGTEELQFADDPSAWVPADPTQYTGHLIHEHGQWLLVSYQATPAEATQ
jgi:hypothetical protein